MISQWLEKVVLSVSKIGVVFLELTEMFFMLLYCIPLLYMGVFMSYVTVVFWRLNFPSPLKCSNLLSGIVAVFCTDSLMI